MLHQWNVTGYVPTSDNEAYTTKSLGAIELGDEDHYDDEAIFSALSKKGLIEGIKIEELEFDGDNDIVYILKTNTGVAAFGLQRDNRWG